MVRRTAQGVWAGMLAGLLVVAGCGVPSGEPFEGGGDERRSGAQGAGGGGAVDCSRPVSGRVSAGDVVGENLGIDAYRYTVVSAEELVVETFGEGGAPVGELRVAFVRPDEEGGELEVVAGYDGAEAEPVEMRLRVFGRASESAEVARVGVHANFSGGGRAYEFRGGLRLGPEGAEHPVAVESAMALADGFEMPASGALPEGIERVDTMGGERWLVRLVEEEEVGDESAMEAWIGGSGIDAAVGEGLTALWLVMGDGNLAGAVEAHLEACRPDYRDAPERYVARQQAAEPVCASRATLEQNKTNAERSLETAERLEGVSLATLLGSVIVGGAVLDAALFGVGTTFTIASAGVVLGVVALVIVAGIIFYWVAQEMRESAEEEAMLADAELRICGNPAHFSSDGLAYDFPFVGEFVWLEGTGEGKSSFAVHLWQSGHPTSRCGGGGRIVGVAARVGLHRVVVRAEGERGARLWIDGRAAREGAYLWELGERGEAGYVEEVYAPGVGQRAFRVVWGSGERLRITGFAGESPRLDATMEHLPPARRGKVRGLAGNLDGDPADDLRLRDGRMLEQPVDWREFAGRFAESWRVGPGESLFGGDGAEKAVRGTENGVRGTGKVVRGTGPGTLEELSDAEIGAARRVCRRRGVRGAALLRFCVRDVACTGDAAYADSFAGVVSPRRELRVRLPDGRVYPDAAARERLMSVAAPEESRLYATRRLPACGESVGDPHQRSFDGLGFNLQAAGEFVMAEARGGDPWVVQARFESVEGSKCPNVTYHTAAATVAGEHRLAWYARRETPLWIDGAPVELIGGEEPLGGGATVRRPDARSWVVTWPGGEILNVQRSFRHLNLNIELPERRRGQIQGVLGRFNGTKADDFALRDGGVLAQPVEWERLYGEFADSWRITQAESLFDYGPGESTETFTDRAIPGRPATVENLPESDRQMARQSCEEAGITDEEVLEDCVLDVACTGDSRYADDHAGRTAPDEGVQVQLPVFLDDWSQQGPPNAGDWVVAEDGRSVVQRRNGNPTFFVSPREYIDTTIRGRFGPNAADNDFIGFVFGYQGPLAERGDDPQDPDFLLFTWKGGRQGGAEEGFTLSRVTAWEDNSDFWEQNDKPGYRVLATDYGDGKGYASRSGPVYAFELTYSAEQAEIRIDGQLIFSVASSELPGGGPFPSGRFGFYNYSQGQVTYTDFSAAPLRGGE